MNFNDHSVLVGSHAFLSGSKYHWIGYSEEKLVATYLRHLAVKKGNELHELAMNLIRLGVKLPKSKKTFNLYVNDAIGYRMTPELVLYYSINAFGTADAISFRKNFLRIHDLKTGTTPTSLHQLEIYAALFCLEYKFKPQDIDIELRIYQTDDILFSEPDPENIMNIMEKLILFDKTINQINEEEL